MFGWLERHWKTIAVAAIATVAFVAVTAATGGLAAPALAAIGASALTTPLAIAAGGFASGAVGYLASQWLNGEKASVKETLKAGAISGVITLATLGVGRLVAPVLEPLAARVVPEAVAALPAPVKVTLANGLAGSALGAGTQATINVATGRPIDENLGAATALGGLNGVLIAPARALIPTPSVALRGSDEIPAGRGIVGALDGEPPRPTFRVPALQRVNPLADTRPYLEQSPSLAKGLDLLLRRGWRVEYGDPTEGTFTKRSQKLIQIASDHASPEDVTQALAHEVGHALDTRPSPFLASGAEKGRYELEGEGKAVLFNTQVRNEVLANTGVDIGVNGDSAGPVSQIASSNLPEAEKLRRIADIFAKAHPSGTGSAMTYDYYYGARNRTLDQLSSFWKRLIGG